MDRNTFVGKVHLYIGDGKGKTTAAAGLCARAAGHGLKVLFLQCLKDGTSGEVAPLKQLGVQTMHIAPPGGQFYFTMNEQQKLAYKQAHLRTFLQIKQQCLQGQWDLLVLDEGLDALALGLWDKQEVYSFIKTRPSYVELVLTGRQADGELTDLADYITRLVKVKHPYEQGCGAREGVEY